MHLSTRMPLLVAANISPFGGCAEVHESLRYGAGLGVRRIMCGHYLTEPRKRHSMNCCETRRYTPFGVYLRLLAHCKAWRTSQNSGYETVWKIELGPESGFRGLPIGDEGGSIGRFLPPKRKGETPSAIFQTVSPRTPVNRVEYTPLLWPRARLTSAQRAC